ncbi:LacI family DNA-binding transcriptional regulator [Cohnella nanjingensis]|uniref:LacI family DNA-binding transcriptional regulator n=1 Tax=Cohnella nanjingensis TaxID=1387779 RepID=A0A7X0RPZ9_9BACL|nr:LacI family DNA-binding transcriptional regulator [Cohnella nanjingensis]MBB6671406.1 LacI family DNA-binding transcriptional regulator [Cohnella nanjingensis]
MTGERTEQGGRRREARAAGESVAEVGIKAIAEALAISPSTVSRALNGKYGVRTETRARIMDMAKRLGYVPHLGAKQLVGKSSNLVGLFAPESQREASLGFVALFPPLQRQLIAQGKHALIFSIPLANYEPGRFAECVLSRGLEGCILLPGFPEQHPMIAEAIRLGVPCVHFGTATGPRCAAVSSDNREGGRLAARLLYGLGHRRIGFIGGPPELRISRERYAGFCEGLAEFGLRHDPALAYEGSFSGASGAEAGQALWERTRRAGGMTALFCANDLMAAGAIMRLAGLGVRIPEQLSVVGYDDDPFAAYLNPPLTTVHHDAEPIDPMAIGLLLEVLEGREGRQVTLLPRIVERASAAAPGGTGPPPISS